MQSANTPLFYGSDAVVPSGGVCTLRNTETGGGNVWKEREKGTRCAIQGPGKAVNTKTSKNFYAPCCATHQRSYAFLSFQLSYMSNDEYGIHGWHTSVWIGCELMPAFQVGKLSESASAGSGCGCWRAFTPNQPVFHGHFPQENVWMKKPPWPVGSGSG